MCIQNNGFKLFLANILGDTIEVDPINIFEIANLHLTGFIIDNKRSQILAFSDRNRRGDLTLTIHVFKLFNILTWEKQ